MKVWTLRTDDGEVVRLPNPDAFSEGRSGYGIYEAANAEGTVIYTGRTKDLAARLRSHAYLSPWWRYVATVRWIPVADYAEAVALERLAIQTDQGVGNTHHKRTFRPSPQELPAAAAERLRRHYAQTDRFGVMDCNAYIRALRRAGWTLQSIGDVLNITREAVRLREAAGADDYDLVAPSPPKKAPRRRKVWPRLSAADTAEMRALHAEATKLRGGHGPDHPYRLAGEELTDRIVLARLRGVRVQDIADAIGLTKAAVMMRLKTRGYLTPARSQHRYGTRRSDWRAA